MDFIWILSFFFWNVSGEMNVMYLFTRYRFNWNEVDFSVFNTFAVVTGLVGKLNTGVKRHKRDQLMNSLEHFLIHPTVFIK